MNKQPRSKLSNNNRHSREGGSLVNLLDSRLRGNDI